MENETEGGNGKEGTPPSLTRMENPFGAWLANQPHSRLQCSIRRSPARGQPASGGPIVFSIRRERRTSPEKLLCLLSPGQSMRN